MNTVQSTRLLGKWLQSVPLHEGEGTTTDEEKLIIRLLQTILSEVDGVMIGRLYCLG